MRLPLPFPVSVNAMYRNVRGVGRVKSKRYKAWNAEAHAMNTGTTMHQIEGPFNAEIVVGRPDKRKRDLDNLAKCVLDLAVSWGLVEDDHLLTSLKMEWSDTMKGAVLYLSEAEVPQRQEHTDQVKSYIDPWPRTEGS